MEETNAFSALNQLMIPQQNLISPSKIPANGGADNWMEMLMKYSQLAGQLPQADVPVVPGELKASPSQSSEVSSENGDVSAAAEQINKALQPIDSQANISANISGIFVDQKPPGGVESWFECFTTTKNSEYEALLFSVYVAERADRKFDGWTHFDCLHRLQSKCRYRVRTKKQDEFYIVEEKGVHNHGAIEPVGQAGSHAGLPKTIREIVDRAYNESWPIDMRTLKVDEEIKRLGLPANPRLGRQIDNRIAYLRRVKNLSESRRIQEQVNGGVPLMPPPTTTTSSMPVAAVPMDPMMFNPQILQALMEQNGGRLTVEKGIVEKLLGPQAVAELAAAQQGLVEHKKEEPLNQNQEFLEFIQQQKMNHDNEQALLAQHALALSAALPTQENRLP